MKHLTSSKKECLHERHSFLKAFQTKLVFDLNLPSPSNLLKSNHAFFFLSNYHIKAKLAVDASYSKFTVFAYNYSFMNIIFTELISPSISIYLYIYCGR